MEFIMSLTASLCYTRSLTGIPVAMGGSRVNHSILWRRKNDAKFGRGCLASLDGAVGDHSRGSGATGVS
jgi:hypothetical protein